jgi:hypothetical protein
MIESSVCRTTNSPRSPRIQAGIGLVTELHNEVGSVHCRDTDPILEMRKDFFFADSRGESSRFQPRVPASADHVPRPTPRSNARQGSPGAPQDSTSRSSAISTANNAASMYSVWFNVSESPQATSFSRRPEVPVRLGHRGLENRVQLTSHIDPLRPLAGEQEGGAPPGRTDPRGTPGAELTVNEGSPWTKSARSATTGSARCSCGVRA